MADKKISDFTAATTVASGDLIEIETAAGNSRKVTGTNFSNSMALLGIRGAMVKKAADQTAANYTAGAYIAYDTEVYDTDGIHDNATNNSRLTVPSGVTWVEVGAQVDLQALDANIYLQSRINKNNASFSGRPTQMVSTNTTGGYLNLSSGPLQVTPGDYFEHFLAAQTDTSITVTAATTSFWMKILG